MLLYIQNIVGMLIAEQKVQADKELMTKVLLLDQQLK